MNKEFVIYTQALALKELGFDEPCVAAYFNQTKEITLSWYPKCIVVTREENYVCKNSSRLLCKCTVPTYSQAFRWLREKHGLIGQPIPLSISYPGKVTHYGWSIVSNQNTNDWENEDGGFKNYEEAEQACLDKLIEIVKNK